MNRITDDERKRILELFYQRSSRKKIADAVHHSSATVQRVIKAHEREVRENGLISELSEEGLTEPLELARLYGQLQRANLSVDDCREAVPIVQKCRELELEEGRLNELIDAAVGLGEPEFPRQQFVGSMLRILRLERETGQTIEQLESTQTQLDSEVRKLQSDETTLNNNIRQLAAQKTQVEADIQSGRERLSALQSRLDRVPVTEAQLETYQSDRNFLVTIGLNMNDPARAEIALIQIARLNYNVAAIIEELVRIRDLNTTFQTLTKNVSDLETSLATLTQQTNNLTEDIQELENRREQVNEKLRKEKEDADKKIMESKNRVMEQLIDENVTERQLSEFVAARDALGKGGVPL
ncbi:MAG: hypothetical protein ABSA92_14245 [Candidatus Bathyarchaeia archaeon]